MKKTATKTAEKAAVYRHLKPREREVLGLMVSEGLRTPKQIAARLQIQPRTARQYVQKLREEGLISITGQPEGGAPGDSGYPTSQGRIRLHGVQVCIGVLGGKEVKELVIPDVFGCRVVVHSRMVEVYTRKDVAFYGSDENEAQEVMMEFFERLAHRLEHDLDCILIKPRAQNWRVVKAEYATEGSEVARRHHVEDVRLEVEDSVSGKVWLWADWSKREPEHETRKKLDSEVVNRRLNDWHDRNPPTDSELYAMIGQLVQYQEQTSLQLRDVAASVNLLLKQFSRPDVTSVPEEGRPDYVG